MAFNSLNSENNKYVDTEKPYMCLKSIWWKEN